MPPGVMNWQYYPTNNGFYCDGYMGKGVWMIDYHFHDGIQKNGVRYRGTSRNAYLPDIPEGRRVLALLIKAFERRLTFIVGTSVTTGQTNVVVWSGIHHKTNINGGSSRFGYPDPEYFYRVTQELADRGVQLDFEGEVD
jgi:deltex